MSEKKRLAFVILIRFFFSLEFFGLFLFWFRLRVFIGHQGVSVLVGRLWLQWYFNIRRDLGFRLWRSRGILLLGVFIVSTYRIFLLRLAKCHSCHLAHVSCNDISRTPATPASILSLPPPAWRRSIYLPSCPVSCHHFSTFFKYSLNALNSSAALTKIDLFSWDFQYTHISDLEEGIIILTFKQQLILHNTSLRSIFAFANL